MKSKRVWLTLIVLAIAAVVIWKLEAQRGRPPQVTFASAARESISSLVSTNGKVEPVESGQARAERAGAVAMTGAVRGVAQSFGPVLAGIAIGAAAFGVPFFAGGALKIAYDGLLYRSFRNRRAEHEL